MLGPTTTRSTQPTSTGSRKVGVCVPDPNGLEILCEALAHVEGGEVLQVPDIAMALDAAFLGRLDALVVLPGVLTADALTALSFLQDARPDVRLYAVEETASRPGYRLCPLANFLIPTGGERAL